jgi:thioredoxin reductase
MAESPTAAQQFDLILLGGGTGGYVAAIRAKQLGFNVAVVEEIKLGAAASRPRPSSSRPTSLTTSSGPPSLASTWPAR